MNASVVALQIALGLGMVAMAVSVLFLRNLMASAVSLAGFSLLLALEFYILQAPDVAIAEAGIGAGLTTAIFMVAIRAVTAKGKKKAAPAAPQTPESPKPEIPVASPAPADPPAAPQPQNPESPAPDVPDVPVVPEVPEIPASPAPPSPTPIPPEKEAP